MPTPQIRLTLRYFNMKHGGFSRAARAAWLKRSPAARAAVQKAQASWERKFGRTKARRGSGGAKKKASGWARWKAKGGGRRGKKTR